LRDSPNRGLCGLDAGALVRRIAGAAREHPGGGWRVACHEGAPVGVVHVQWAEEPGAASLGFLGILPAHRRRGLGAALHASALQLLSSLGVRAYRDATDVRNRAMRAVFFWNGCRVVGVTRHHRASPPAEEAPCS
jgi:RimJ/RimL family protein N-acetyltransferase